MAWCNVFRSTSTKCFLYSSMLERLKFSMCLLGGPKNMMLTSKRDVGPYVVYDWNLRNHSMMKSVLLVIEMHIKIVSRNIVKHLLTEFEGNFPSDPRNEQFTGIARPKQQLAKCICPQKQSINVLFYLSISSLLKQFSCIFLLPAMLISFFSVKCNQNKHLPKIMT